MTVVLAILLFGFFILSHEFGHYVTARIFGVGVREFSVGMGPAIVDVTSKKTGTKYALRLLPFGGYVSMTGENDGFSDGNAQENEASSGRSLVDIIRRKPKKNDFFREIKGGSFEQKPVWQRIIICLSGATVNIITGLLFMLCVVLCMQNLGSTIVANFTNESAVSESCGLCVGDEIIKVNNARVDTSYALYYEIMYQGCDKVDLTVIRDGEEIILHDVEFPTYTSSGILCGDADFQVYGLKKNAGNIVKYTFSQTFTSCKMIWQSLLDLVKGRYGIESVSGPVGTTEVISSAAKQSASSFFMIASVIGINLGIVNLLPLPALDGGRIVFFLIELIFKKPVPKKIETFINLAGLAILLGFSLIVTCKDITMLFK